MHPNHFNKGYTHLIWTPGDESTFFNIRSHQWKYFVSKTSKDWSISDVGIFRPIHLYTFHVTAAELFRKQNLRHRHLRREHGRWRKKGHIKRAIVFQPQFLQGKYWYIYILKPHLFQGMYWYILQITFFSGKYWYILQTTFFFRGLW